MEIEMDLETRAREAGQKLKALHTAYENTKSLAGQLELQRQIAEVFDPIAGELAKDATDEFFISWSNEYVRGLALDLRFLNNWDAFRTRFRQII